MVIRLRINENIFLSRFILKKAKCQRLIVHWLTACATSIPLLQHTIKLICLNVIVNAAGIYTTIPFI